MNNYKILFSLGWLLLAQVHLFGQYVLPNFQSQTVHKEELMIRWEPRTLAEWQTSIQQGYDIKVYGGTTANSLSLLSTQNIKPAAAGVWDKALSGQTDSLMQAFYQGAKSFLYTDPEIEAELKESLEEEVGKSKQQTFDEFRLGYLAYAITFDMNMIELAGLGYKMPVETGKVYRIEVQTKNHDIYQFNYDPAKKTKVAIPDLDATFGDKKVTLQWSTPEFKEHFYGYYLSRSENGKRYEKVSPMPYVNILDTISTNEDAQYLTEEVQLPKNYKDYWFRLRGMNYFGIESVLSSTQKGYGFEIIDAMPIINYSNQTEDNHAEIRWTLNQSFNRLIDHFAVYRSDELEGEYKVVYDSIPVGDRTVSVPMEYNRNYFSIGIVPKDGPVIRSFSVFVMGQDTVPPVIPQNFAGVIDSMGVVTFTWDRNQEEDLWGYKLFRSEYFNDEYGPLHPSPITDTFYVDTVNLNSINDKIHYTIIALDKRNNRSAFAPVISLERPDTIPPSPPLVKKAEFLEDSIRVKWAASSSNDAVLHQLFRRELSEKGWRLVSEFRSVDAMNYYVDTDYEMGKIYAYTVTATDEVDLRSAPSRAVKVQTISKRPKEAFTSIDVDFDQEKAQSSIRWNLKNEKDLEEIIVYRGPSRQEISMYKIVTPDSKEIVQDFSDSEEWFFVFKPVFHDGSRARMSEVIEVKQPK